MGAQGIETELGRGRAGRHQDLPGLGVQILGWNRNGTIWKNKTQTTSCNIGPGTEDTLVFFVFSFFILSKSEPNSHRNLT